MKETLSCPACSYPINLSTGEQGACAHCGQRMEAIEGSISQGLPIPWHLVAFISGMFIGPILIASTSRGRDWLEKRARGT